MSNRPPASRRPRGRRGVWSRFARWLAVVLVVAGGLLALRAWRAGSRGVDLTTEIAGGGGVDGGPVVGDRSVTLVFPDRNATSYLTEQRRIASQGRLEEDLLQTMRELCRGPDNRDAVSSLPPRTRPLAVFLDAENRNAVLDFSAELVTGHPGGSTAETATLTSILRTVALNFPALESCRILVDGGEVQTLAGHHILDEPFVLRRWL